MRHGVIAPHTSAPAIQPAPAGLDLSFEKMMCRQQKRGVRQSR
jgi:hypothetical protein